MSTETAYKKPKKSFIELLLELQLRDASVGKWKYDDPKGGPRLVGSKRDWRVDHRGLLYYKEAVYMPKDMAVRQEIMKINYDNLYSRHFSVARTTELICYKYFWPAITKDIQGYVYSCDIYQRIKTL